MAIFPQQLKDAQSENDISALLAEENTLDILQRCGITATVKVSFAEVL